MAPDHTPFHRRRIDNRPPVQNKKRRAWRSLSADRIVGNMWLTESRAKLRWLQMKAPRLGKLALLACAALSFTTAQAQSFPIRTVRILAPYSAGAGPAVFTK